MEAPYSQQNYDEYYDININNTPPPGNPTGIHHHHHHSTEQEPQITISTITTTITATAATTPTTIEHKAQHQWIQPHQKIKAWMKYRPPKHPQTTERLWQKQVKTA